MPLGLILFGLVLGVLAGSVLPPGLRGWVAGRLPAPLARLGGPAVTPAPSAPPAPSATPPPLPPEMPTPAVSATPLPRQSVIPPKQREVARLYNGMQVRSLLEAEPGKQAAAERETFADYALDLRLQIKVPTAAKAPEEIARSAPGLLAALPKLGSLLEKSEVSKFYFGLYQNKTEVLRQNLPRLDALLSRDTFYDTDTILEIQDPDSQRKVLLIQSDMDVDSDGSDADRLPDVDGSDPSFQPLTSYKWARRTPNVNPQLTAFRDRLARQEAELARPGATPRRGAQAAAESLRNEVYQLEHYSSLISKTDPYIVLPGFMARQSGHPFQPKLGDYAVVLANDKLYPAIFGDIGPSDRSGEASLRLAQAVDPRATAERSPVDTLKITYLVFPGSVDGPAGPPDLGKMRQRCQQLLNEIGGSKLELYEWANLIPPPTSPPTPTPGLLTPVPVASPGPGGAGPSPAASPGGVKAGGSVPTAAPAQTPTPVGKPSPAPGSVSTVPAPKPGATAATPNPVSPAAARSPVP